MPPVDAGDHQKKTSMGEERDLVGEMGKKVGTTGLERRKKRGEGTRNLREITVLGCFEVALKKGKDERELVWGKTKRKLT